MGIRDNGKGLDEDTMKFRPGRCWSGDRRDASARRGVWAGKLSNAQPGNDCRGHHSCSGTIARHRVGYRLTFKRCMLWFLFAIWVVGSDASTHRQSDACVNRAMRVRIQIGPRSRDLPSRPPFFLRVSCRVGGLRRSQIRPGCRRASARAQSRCGGSGHHHAPAQRVGGGPLD